MNDLKALALAATSGPWFAEAPPAAVSDYDACRSQYHAVVTRGCCIADDALPRDAAYIAAAHPQAVLALLARIEQAEQDRDQADKAAEILRGDLMSALSDRQVLRAKCERLEAALRVADAALVQVDVELVCQENDDTAHYCPNCDRSLFNARAEVRAACAAISQPGAAAAGGTGAAAVSKESGRLDPNLVRIERLEAALKELVACKDLKDRLDALQYPNSDAQIADLKEYARRKPLAWDAARALCNAP